MVQAYRQKQFMLVIMSDLFEMVERGIRKGYSVELLMRGVANKVVGVIGVSLMVIW
jgi:hypothetical protein